MTRIFEFQSGFLEVVFQFVWKHDSEVYSLWWSTEYTAWIVHKIIGSNSYNAYFKQQGNPLSKANVAAIPDPYDVTLHTNTGGVTMDIVAKCHYAKQVKYVANETVDTPPFARNTLVAKFDHSYGNTRTGQSISTAATPMTGRACTVTFDLYFEYIVYIQLNSTNSEF